MNTEIVRLQQIASTICVIRGKKALRDADLARLYGVTTGNLNKAVTRNRNRFPKDFMFRLNTAEAERLLFQFGIAKGPGGRRASPYAFREQGIAMLSSVLNSERAVKVNIAIMRAFVKPRQTIATNSALARKSSAGERTRLACWRLRPRDRELYPRCRRAKFVLARFQNQDARRACSPSR